MDEYIKREEIKKAIHCSGDDLLFKGDKTFINFEIVKKAVLDTPAADVVEVVRCKDCKNKTGEINQCGNIYCSLHQGYFDKDAFCSYGERQDA